MNNILWVKSFILFADNLLKNKIDTLYEENASRKVLKREFPPEKSEFLPGKLPPKNFSAGIFPTISLIVFLIHLRLCFDKFLQTERLQHF